MLGRTLKDGQRHEVRWQADRLDATIEHIRRSSNDATGPPEINALVQRIVITDDRRSAIDELVAARPTLAVSDAMTTPFVAIGTVDEIVEHLLTCRARWGISYFSVREIDSFQPVIERLRAVDGRN